MKKSIFFISVALMIFINMKAGNPVNSKVKSTSSRAVVYLTNETFKSKVFNYENNKTWNYLGNKPAIIDFYASWCGPCRQVSPIIEELAKEYNDRIVVYKVDTDKEQLLSQNLGIQSLPTILFIPVNGQPQVIMGALPKEQLVKAIHEVLLVK
jgi:thioredoxin 1